MDVRLLALFVLVGLRSLPARAASRESLHALPATTITVVETVAAGARQPGMRPAASMSFRISLVCSE
jgi:hypothetical protein